VEDGDLADLDPEDTKRATHMAPNASKHRAAMLGWLVGLGKVLDRDAMRLPPFLSGRVKPPVAESVLHLACSIFLQPSFLRDWQQRALYELMVRFNSEKGGWTFGPTTDERAGKCKAVKTDARCEAGKPCSFRAKEGHEMCGGHLEQCECEPCVETRAAKRRRRDAGGGAGGGGGAGAGE
jgi:hypothetical protein